MHDQCVHPIGGAGHSPKRKEFARHMVAVLVVLVMKICKNIPERAACICCMVQKSLGNSRDKKLIEAVENNSDETGPNCRGV